MRETGRSDGQMQDGLMMLSFNCRSTRNKVTELTSKLNELDIDSCMLQESWLSKGDDSVIAEIKDHGFEILSKRRSTGSRGGGLAVLYKTFINVRMFKRKENYTSFEYMIFTITAKYKLISVILIYRPDYSKKHKVNSSTFLKKFSKLLDDITSLPGILVITADFNTHFRQ